MGMSYTGFGAPVTTKNLKANADLDLGNYDLTATDVKGDTAEFDEFVGGVGNFTNVLGSGNLDIEGTGNIKGLTTFQNAVQVNGALHVEGSINNVNIADNGEITTAQGVNGADFNGAKITSTKFNGATIDTSGNVTGAKGTFSGAVTGASGAFSGAVTGSNIKTVINVSSNGTHNTSTGFRFPTDDAVVMVLPPLLGVKYNGTIKYYSNGDKANIKYVTSLGGSATEAYGVDNGIKNITFSNAQCLLLTVIYNQTNFELCDINLA